MILKGIPLFSHQIYRNLGLPRILSMKNMQNLLWRSFSNDSHIVQMRGLDCDTREEDIFNFFRPLGITPKNVFLRWDGSGRTASVSEVEFNTHADAIVAMRKKNAFLGNKFIRLTLKSSEISEVLKKDETPDTQSSLTGSLNIETKTDTSHPGGSFLRMKNVPWRITDLDIYEFFWHVGAYAVSVKPLYNESGFRTGEFDVQFLNDDDAHLAMAKNNAYLCNKFVQLSYKHM